MFAKIKNIKSGLNLTYKVEINFPKTEKMGCLHYDLESVNVEQVRYVTGIKYDQLTFNVENNSPVITPLVDFGNSVRKGHGTYYKNAKRFAKAIESIINEYIKSGECFEYYGERTCILTERIRYNDVRYDIYFDCPTQDWASELIREYGWAFRGYGIFVECHNGCTLSIYKEVA